MKRFSFLAKTLVSFAAPMPVQGQAIADAVLQLESESTLAQQVGARQLLPVCPTALFLKVGPRVLRANGAILGTGSALVDAAEKFTTTHAGLFDVESSDIIQSGHVAVAPESVSSMQAPGTRGPQLTLVNYPQVRDGIPIFRSNP